MEKCPKCEHDLIKGLRYCFNCGEEVEKKDTKDSSDKKCKPKSRLDVEVLDAFFN